MNVDMSKRLIKYAIALVAVVFLFAGCQQPDDDDSVSIGDRISAFIADANADNFSSMYVHIHSTANDYEASKSADTWSTVFPADDYSLGTLTTAGSVVTSTISGGTYSSDPIRFTMLESGSDIWMIKKLEIDPDGNGYDVIVE